jgi:hypothetical protein
MDPHTLVVAPANRPVRLVTQLESDVKSRPPRAAEPNLAPMWTQQGEVQENREATFVSGSFRAAYGAALYLFAPLTSPIIEAFDKHGQLDKLISYAITELAAGEPGGGPMAQAPSQSPLNG